MKTYWLSFADEDSGRNLGVCVVQVSDEHVAEAVEVATRVNPEGYPGDDWVLAAIGRSRLMVPSRTESASRFRQGRGVCGHPPVHRDRLACGFHYRSKAGGGDSRLTVRT